MFDYDSYRNRKVPLEKIYYMLKLKNEDIFSGGSSGQAVPKLYRIGNAKSSRKIKHNPSDWEIIPVTLTFGEPV